MMTVVTWSLKVESTQLDWIVRIRQQLSRRKKNLRWTQRSFLLTRPLPIKHTNTTNNSVSVLVSSVVDFVDSNT